MELNIGIKQIVCRRETKGWGKDEIYYSVHVLPVKKVDGKLIPTNGDQLFHKVSNVRTMDEEENKVWSVNDSIAIDLGDGVEGYAVMFGLYEHDDGLLHQSLQNGEGTEYQNAGWSDGIPLPDLTNNQAEWLKYLIKAFNRLYKNLKSDDRISVEPIALPSNLADSDTRLVGPREFTMKGCGGEYKLAVELSV